METLILACIVFLATHFVSSTPLRAAAVAAMGEKAWLGLYTVVSFATIGWMVWAYNRAPVEHLWAGWRLAPAILMPFAFTLLAGGLLTRNPSAVGQHKALKAEEPARGMLRVTRHPMMWGFALWAVTHLITVGTPKAMVLDGAILLLALGGSAGQDAKKSKLIGEAWHEWTAQTAFIPFTRGIGNPGLVALVGGILLFLLATWLHPMPVGFWRWIG